MKTIEINVGSLGSNLHVSTQQKKRHSGGRPYQYSAGGEPYKVRLVVAAQDVDFWVEGLDAQSFTVLDGTHSF